MAVGTAILTTKQMTTLFFTATSELKQACSLMSQGKTFCTVQKIVRDFL
jgi:hypothetical protein